LKDTRWPYLRKDERERKTRDGHRRCIAEGERPISVNFGDGTKKGPAPKPKKAPCAR